MAQLLAAEPSWPDDLFDVSFVKAVPPAQTRNPCKQLFQQRGSIEALNLLQRDSALALGSAFKLYVLGALGPMGNGSALRNRPFVSTGEMFRLKYVDGGNAGEAYLQLEDVAARRAVLDDRVAAMPLDENSIDQGAFAAPQSTTRD